MNTWLADACYDFQGTQMAVVGSDSVQAPSPQALRSRTLHVPQPVFLLYLHLSEAPTHPQMPPHPLGTEAPSTPAPAAVATGTHTHSHPVDGPRTIEDPSDDASTMHKIVSLRKLVWLLPS